MNMASILIKEEKDYPFLQPFASRHGLITIQDIFKHSISEYWKFEGFNVHIQNDILDLVSKYGLQKELKMG